MNKVILLERTNSINITIANLSVRALVNYYEYSENGTALDVVINSLKLSTGIDLVKELPYKRIFKIEREIVKKLNR